MNIILGEGDEYLYEDGKARNIILTIGNKRMIIPTDKTIADLCLIVQKLGIMATPEPIVSIPPYRTPNLSIVEVSDPLKIQLNDYVRYIGKANPDNPDLIVGNEYRILEVHKDTFDIISDTMPMPIRLGVLKSDVVLIRKSTLKPVIPIRIFEQITNCGFCQTQNVLQLDEAENKYKGICFKCSKPLEIERKV